MRLGSNLDAPEVKGALVDADALYAAHEADEAHGLVI